MSKHPAPDRERHDDFCVIENWELVHGSTGKPVQHHRTYELAIPSGDILRTRIQQLAGSFQQNLNLAPCF